MVVVVGGWLRGLGLPFWCFAQPHLFLASDCGALLGVVGARGGCSRLRWCADKFEACRLSGITSVRGGRHCAGSSCGQRQLPTSPGRVTARVVLATVAYLRVVCGQRVVQAAGACGGEAGRGCVCTVWAACRARAAGAACAWAELLVNIADSVIFVVFSASSPVNTGKYSPEKADGVPCAHWRSQV